MTISRDTIANAYIRGCGIEVGALHNPLRVPADARVSYVDRLSVSDLRRHYPELNDKELVKVDIIDDGEKLGSIGDATQDFVIANHFIEHAQNPILAIRNMLRILKENGILYCAAPDMRYCFDRNRPLTSFEHLLRDYTEGPEWSRTLHFEDWVRNVDNIVDDGQVRKRIAVLMELDYSIHYHVFTQADIIGLFVRLKGVLKYDYEFELALRNDSEIIIILRKSSAPAV